MTEASHGSRDLHDDAFCLLLLPGLFYKKKCVNLKAEKDYNAILPGKDNCWDWAEIP